MNLENKFYYKENINKEFSIYTPQGNFIIDVENEEIAKDIVRILNHSIRELGIK